MAQSIAILDTLQIKFLHNREVVAKNEMCTPFVHTKKTSSNMHFYRNFCPLGCSVR